MKTKSNRRPTTNDKTPTGTKKPVTPQVKALPGVTPLGINPTGAKKKAPAKKKASGAKKKSPTFLKPTGTVFTAAELIGHIAASGSASDIPSGIRTEDLTAFYHANVPAARQYKSQDREQATLAVLDLLLEIKERAAHEAEKLSDKTPKSPKKGSGAAPKAKKTGEANATARPGRVSSHAGKHIFILTEGKKNPRREGTHGHRSFSLIKEGMLVEDYFTAGGRSNDLAWDIDHKFVEVK
jgi:hypothetical protein